MSFVLFVLIYVHVCWCPTRFPYKIEIVLDTNIKFFSFYIMANFGANLLFCRCIQGSKCSTNVCNNGFCVKKGLAEVRCFCSDGYKGLFCAEQIDIVSDYKLKTTMIVLHVYTHIGTQTYRNTII